MTEERFWTGSAVITGAGSGLGAAMADRFSGAGLAIVALDIDQHRAEEKAKEIQGRGGRAIAMGVDVADRHALERAAAAATEAFGSINVLCANVGVQQFGAADRLSVEDWRWVLDVNVIGVANTVSTFLPLLRSSSGNRRVVMTASSAVLAPGVRLSAYTASKFAIMGYGETLRMELADEGIGVSVLFPASMSSRHLESSKLARPAALGASVILPDDIEALIASRKVDSVTNTVTPDYATRHLLEDLEKNCRFIVTHGQYVDALRERFEDLIQSLNRAQV